MDKFTPKILHNIFTRFSLEQRFVCTLVCRKWWHVLDKSSLFYSVRDINIRDLINYFEQRPEHAAQVQHLSFIIGIDRRFCSNILLKIFPNVRVVKALGACGMKSYKFRHNESRNDIEKSNIQVLHDAYHCDLTYQVIDSNLGGRLRELYLDFAFVTGPHYIIASLKCLPVLKRLHLKSPEINVFDLEALHDKVSSIQEFFLYKMELKGTRMPFNITPTTALTKFKISQCRFSEMMTHIQFYRYMEKKYINVIDGEYNDDALHGTNSKQIYYDGVLSFFGAIGPRQRKLAIYGLPDGIDPFKYLDAAGAKIKSLSLRNCQCSLVFKYMSRSDQSNHIETLDVKGALTESLFFIKSMSALTTLKIDGYRLNNNIDLVSFLDACPPTLKDYIISPQRVTINSFHNRVYLIEHLDIELGFLCTIPGKLGGLISTCFPKLVNLKLGGCMTENVNIMLKNPRFQEATFITINSYRNEVGHGFSFKSPHQTETRFYVCGTKKKVHVQYDDIPDLPLLSVVSCIDKRLKVDKNIKVLPW